jgi:hypothetical protein
MPEQNKTPTPDALAAMVDSIRVFSEDNVTSFDEKEKRLVDNLPAKTYILYKMNDPERDILYRSIRHIWKIMTGEEPEFTSKNQDSINLDGVYWMLPGGVLLSGFNHFQTAKNNKLLVCSMLDINTMVFEKLLASEKVEEVISLILARGGVRVLIDREKSEVVMQTNESSWPWVKQKLERMYHKHKIAKILDLSKPYEGWTSGVTLNIS